MRWEIVITEQILTDKRLYEELKKKLLNCITQDPLPPSPPALFANTPGDLGRDYNYDLPPSWDDRVIALSICAKNSSYKSLVTASTMCSLAYQSHLRRSVLAVPDH